jgi:DNA-binding XRE family transcriptional regulator
MNDREKVNYRRGLIIMKDGSICNAASALGIHESRLSRIIHGRVRPNQNEKRKIAWHLQKPISDLFPQPGE